MGEYHLVCPKTACWKSATQPKARNFSCRGDGPLTSLWIIQWNFPWPSLLKTLKYKTINNRLFFPVGLGYFWYPPTFCSELWGLWVRSMYNCIVFSWLRLWWSYSFNGEDFHLVVSTAHLPSMAFPSGEACYWHLNHRDLVIGLGHRLSCSRLLTALNHFCLTSLLGLMQDMSVLIGNQGPFDYKRPSDDWA